MTFDLPPIPSVAIRRYSPGDFTFSHSHGHCELLLVHEGYGDFAVGGDVFLVQPNTLFFIDGDKPHAIGIEAGVSFVRSVVDVPEDSELLATAVRALRQSPRPAVFVASEDVTTLEGRMHALKELETVHTDFSHAHRYTALAELLFTAARILTGAKPAVPGVGALGDPLVKSVLAYLPQCYSTATSAELAKHFGVSLSSLCHRFRRTTDHSISQYVAKLRLEEARRLLEGTDLPVSEVGRRVGYPNACYFSDLFSRATGIGPRNYRRGVREGAGSVRS